MSVETFHPHQKQTEELNLNWKRLTQFLQEPLIKVGSACGGGGGIETPSEPYITYVSTTLA
jgi:hypothetical protein